MRRFSEPDIDLFGQDTGFNVSLGEHYLINEYFLKNDEFISRADWVFENLPYTGTLQLEIEDSLLLENALKAYIFGLYSVVIIGADAFCERILTDAVESREDTKVARKGFWHLTKRARRQRFIDDFLLGRIERLHNTRNGLCHPKDDKEVRLDHRSVREGRHYLYLMKQDAKEGLCLMYGLAGKHPRNFPRLAIPGVGIVDKIRREYTAKKNKKTSQ